MKKVLKVGGEYQLINGSEVELMGSLPAGIYEMKAASMRGFWYEKMELEAFSGKVYGEQKRMEEKVMRRYAAVSGRNLGVLLSGGKGTGKSLFVRNLAVKLAKDIPVIVVKRNLGEGMLDSLAGISGRAVIVFDEFEKMFRGDEDNFGGNTGDIREQEKVLSFFDGIETKQEKLLLLTVNEERCVSQYLLGRPGRIHYHFRMFAPSSEEIMEYLEDNLSDSVKQDIEMIADALSARALSWDSVEAVVMELNSGESFDDTMDDLNVGERNVDTTRLVFRATFEDGSDDLQFFTVGCGSNILIMNFNSSGSTYDEYAPSRETVSVKLDLRKCTLGERQGEYVVNEFTQYVDKGDTLKDPKNRITRLTVMRESTMDMVKRRARTSLPLAI